MRAVWNEVTLAQSDRTVVVEGNHYFPPDSIHEDALSPSAHRTLCPWKGRASYFTVQAGGERNADAAWTYRHPLLPARHIRDHVAFWKGVEVVP